MTGRPAGHRSGALHDMATVHAGASEVPKNSARAERDALARLIHDLRGALATPDGDALPDMGRRRWIGMLVVLDRELQRWDGKHPDGNAA
ncbi:MAG: hypothetical protein ACP5QO_02700 [Clostridia bacterium]